MPTVREDLHEEFQRADDEPAGASSEHSFGLLLATVCGVLSVLAWHAGRQSALWWLAAAIILTIVALAAPHLLALPKRLWLKLGYALHVVVSPIILAIMFFVVITPMGMLMRLRGHDPMRRRSDRAVDSYWIVRNPPGPAPPSMRQQF
jgi:hypothetical protein